MSVRRDPLVPLQAGDARPARCKRGVRCVPVAPAHAGAQPQSQWLPARPSGLRRGDAASDSATRFFLPAFALSA